jgi:hypothetical protein
MPRVWPELNTHGDLPPGVHRATLAEVVERFGIGTPQRRLVAQRLERVYTLAMSTGHVERFVVFGSFVTAKPDPNDVDNSLLMDDDFDASQLSGEAALIFAHRAAQNYEGASLFWIRRLAAIGGEEAAVTYWQIKRDGSQRGIVEVTSSD